jgi:hypothetical protein
MADGIVEAEINFGTSGVWPWEMISNTNENHRTVAMRRFWKPPLSQLASNRIQLTSSQLRAYNQSQSQVQRVVTPNQVFAIRNSLLVTRSVAEDVLWLSSSPNQLRKPH